MLLVAVRDSLWGMVRDGGQWRSERLLTKESNLQCVAADPRRQGRIYCGTSAEGLWRSDDLGSSWVRVGAGILHPRVTAVTVAPREWGSDTGRGAGEHGASAQGAGRGAGTGGDGAIVYVGTEPSALFHSADGGESWEECRALLALPSAPTWSFPPRPETSHVRWIAPDPLEAGRLFVAVEAGALITSYDAGRSWTDRRPGGPYDTHTLVVHSRIRDRLYSAAGDGYFESQDGGVTWERREDGLAHRYAWGLAVDPVDPECVVISAARSAGAAHAAERAESWIYRKLAGGPWRPVRQGLPEPTGTTISTLVVDPEENGVVYAANNRGVYISSDRGESWNRIDITWPEVYGAARVAGMTWASRAHPGETAGF